MQPAVQTLVVAIVVGILAQWAGRLIRLPAIILLLLAGAVVGPQMLGLTARPSETLGTAFSALVELSVVIILFDGGLSLFLQDLRSTPIIVRNLLSVGAVLTFAGGAACAHFLAGMDWPISALFGSLVIVTGPTVIVPLLQHIHLTRRVHAVLLWEGILIDAIGALAAVVTVELLFGGRDLLVAGGNFLGALLIGPALGAAGGFAMATWLKRRQAQGHQDDELNHLLALAGAIGIFGASELCLRGSGLAAVTCGGLVVSNVLGRAGGDLRRAKSSLTKFLVSVLFILLAADFDLHSLRSLWPGGFIAVAALLFLVRPVNVLVCAYRSRLNWRERLFLCWMSPRGIVAASVASLFGLMLRQMGMEELGEELVAITFLTIVMSVLFSGLAAGPLARLFKVQLVKPKGLLIVGANELAQQLAALYDLRGIPTLMVDTNPDLCEQARQAGFSAIEGSALDAEFLAKQDLGGIGAILSMTPSASVNAQAAAHFLPLLNLGQAYVVNCGFSRAETRLVSRSRSQVAFAKEVDVDAVCDLLRAGKGRLRSCFGAAALAKVGGNFLPLACVRGDLLLPYSLDDSLSDETEVIGIEFASLVSPPPFQSLPAPAAQS